MVKPNITQQLDCSQQLAEFIESEKANYQELINLSHDIHAQNKKYENLLIEQMQLNIKVDKQESLTTEEQQVLNELPNKIKQAKQKLDQLHMRRRELNCQFQKFFKFIKNHHQQFTFGGENKELMQQCFLLYCKYIGYIPPNDNDKVAEFSSQYDSNRENTYKNENQGSILNWDNEKSHYILIDIIINILNPTELNELIKKAVAKSIGPWAMMPYNALLRYAINEAIKAKQQDQKISEKILNLFKLLISDEWYRGNHITVKLTETTKAATTAKETAKYINTSLVHPSITTSYIFDEYTFKNRAGWRSTEIIFGYCLFHAMLKKYQYTKEAQWLENQTWNLLADDIRSKTLTVLLNNPLVFIDTLNITIDKGKGKIACKNAVISTIMREVILENCLESWCIIRWAIPKNPEVKNLIIILEPLIKLQSAIKGAPSAPNLKQAIDTANKYIQSVDSAKKIASNIYQDRISIAKSILALRSAIESGTIENLRNAIEKEKNTETQSSEFTTELKAATLLLNLKEATKNKNQINIQIGIDNIIKFIQVNKNRTRLFEKALNEAPKILKELPPLTDPKKIAEILEKELKLDKVCASKRCFTIVEKYEKIIIQNPTTFKEQIKKLFSHVAYYKLLGSNSFHNWQNEQKCYPLLRALFRFVNTPDEFDKLMKNTLRHKNQEDMYVFNPWLRGAIITCDPNALYMLYGNFENDKGNYCGSYPLCELHKRISYRNKEAILLGEAIEAVKQKYGAESKVAKKLQGKFDRASDYCTYNHKLLTLMLKTFFRPITFAKIVEKEYKHILRSIITSHLKEQHWIFNTLNKEFDNEFSDDPTKRWCFTEQCYSAAKDQYYPKVRKLIQELRNLLNFRKSILKNSENDIQLVNIAKNNANYLKIEYLELPKNLADKMNQIKTMLTLYAQCNHDFNQISIDNTVIELETMTQNAKQLLQKLSDHTYSKFVNLNGFNSKLEEAEKLLLLKQQPAITRRTISDLSMKKNQTKEQLTKTQKQLTIANTKLTEENVRQQVYTVYKENRDIKNYLYVDCQEKVVDAILRNKEYFKQDGKMDLKKIGEFIYQHTSFCKNPATWVNNAAHMTDFFGCGAKASVYFKLENPKEIDKAIEQFTSNQIKPN